MCQTSKRLRKRTQDCEDHTDFSSSVNKKSKLKVMLKDFHVSNPKEEWLFGKVYLCPYSYQMNEETPQTKKNETLSPDNKLPFSLALICLLFFFYQWLFIHSFIFINAIHSFFIHSFIQSVSQSVSHLFIYLFIHSFIHFV